MYKFNCERTGYVLCSSLQDIGKVQWHLKDFKIVGSNAIIVSKAGYLYCIGSKKNSRSASLFKIDSTDGKIHSSIELEEDMEDDIRRFFATPVITGDFIYFLYQPVFSPEQPKLYCFDITTLKCIFKVDIYESMETKYIDITADWFKNSVCSSPLIVNTSIYIGTRNGYICSFNATTGILEWMCEISHDFAIGHLAYADGYLYAESSNRDLYSVDIAQQSIQWKFDCMEGSKRPKTWGNTVPLIVGDKIYLYSNLQSLYAINREDGELIWKYSVKGQGSCSYFVASSDTLIGIMPDYSIHSIDLNNGSKKWAMNPGERTSSLVLTKDSFLLSNGGYLFVISTSNGQIVSKWEIPFNWSMVANPLYLFIQVVNNSYKSVYGNLFLAGISTPCVDETGIFISAVNGPSKSLFKLTYS